MLLDDSAQAKIGNLDGRVFCLAPVEHIFGFDVAMHNPDTAFAVQGSSTKVYSGFVSRATIKVMNQGLENLWLRDEGIHALDQI